MKTRIQMKSHTAEFTSTDVDIIQQEVIYQGHLKLLKYDLKYRLFAGGWSPVVIRELFQSRAAVGVLLFDPIRDEIVLIEEFRLGALEQKSPWILELVAGIIEPNESVVDVAKRECQEEAGCTVVDL